MGPDEKCFKLTIVVRVGVWGVVIFLYIADNAVDDDELMLNVLRCHLTY